MEGALALCRFVQFLAAATLFGVELYAWALAPPSLAAPLAPALRRICAAAIVSAAISALAWLSLEAAAMSDAWRAAFDSDAIGAVAYDTAFGVIWRWRLALVAVLVGALALGRHGASIVMVALSGLLLASLSLVGHGAMDAGGVGTLHRANDAIHLLTAGAWIGGLPAFALSLRAYRDATLRDAAARAMKRFSVWGQFGVALLLASGAANVGFISGWATFAALTPYRALLALKLVLVASMVGLALFNRFILSPRLQPGASAERALLVSCLVELAFAAAVVALVSVFGLLDPN